MPIRIAVKFDVAIKVGNWRRVGVTVVKGTHLVSGIGARWCSFILLNHVHLFVFHGSSTFAG